MLSHAQGVAAAIESLQGMLQVATVLIDAGRTVDLGGLDQEAARICVAVGTLPPTEARPLRPGLEALLREVDRTMAALASPTA